MLAKRIIFFVFSTLILCCAILFLSSFSFFSICDCAHYKSTTTITKNKNSTNDYSAGGFFISALKSEDGLSECDVFSELVIFSKDEISVEDIVCFYRADFVKKEKVCDIEIYYYKSSLLKKCVKSGELEFNLQIIISDKEIILCYPINIAGF